MNDPILGLVLDAVTCRLGSRQFRFDGRAPKGVITAVTGASGSGKSTLLNLVAGFEPPQGGRILFDGQDLAGLYPGDRPLSLVFQDNNLFAHLDLAGNVGLGIDPGLRLAADDRARIDSALGRVGLAGFGPRLPGSLSGGERQRAAFARALVRRRPLLLLDEPFAALDPELRADMGDLLLDLQQETGATVLLVSHDAAEVLRLAQHVFFIAEDRIAFSGTAEQFAEAPRSDIRRFLGRAETERSG